jgi:hypothetical protein
VMSSRVLLPCIRRLSITTSAPAPTFVSHRSFRDVDLSSSDGFCGLRPELAWPSLILAIIGILVSVPVYVFCQHGSVRIPSSWS